MDSLENGMAEPWKLEEENEKLGQRGQSSDGRKWQGGSEGLGLGGSTIK